MGRFSLILAVFCALGAFSRSVAGAGIEPPVLRAALESEPLSLDWNGARTSTDRFLVSFLMRGLLKYDASNKPVCDLCKTFSVSPDGKILRFELNPAEEWSDGVKLEAQHFVDSFRRLLSPANHFKPAEAFRWIEGAQQSSKTWDPKKLAVRAEGRDQLEIVLSRPQSALPHLLTTSVVYPVRKELLKGTGDSGENHASTAVLGPYQLAAWEHGKRVVIEGNPRFKGSRPVYRVDFVLGTHAQLLAKFKAGRLDLLSNPTNEDLMNLPSQRLQVNPYWATRELVLNVSRAPMSDGVFRRAILHALNRDSLPAHLRNGERKVTGLVPPGLVGYRDLPLATADLAQAQKERAQAVPGGKPVDLVLLSLDRDADRRVAEWIADRLGQIQVRVKLHGVSSSAFGREIEAGRHDLVLVTRSLDIASPLELLDPFESSSLHNRGHWANVGFDALLGQLSHEQNPTQAAAFVDQLTQIIEVKDIGVIPLGYPTQPFMLGPRVVSFAITPFGDPDLVKIQLKQ